MCVKFSIFFLSIYSSFKVSTQIAIVFLSVSMSLMSLMQIQISKNTNYIILYILNL